MGGEAHRPQHPQGVLGKPPVRVAHAADHVSEQIHLPAVPVDHHAVLIQGHGVDGEVPPGQILRQGGVEVHRVRVAAVGIARLPAEGGHLHRPVLRPHRDRAVAQAGGDRVGKELHHPLRPGVGAHIEIPRRPAQQQIPHAAPHRVGRVSCPPQRVQAAPHSRWNGPSLHFSASLWYLFLAICL